MLRAVPNPNTNPIQIQRDGVNLTSISRTEARTLRDDLNRMLGESGERKTLAAAVVDAARAWNQKYSTDQGYGGCASTRLALRDAVERLAGYDNVGRPITNFDTGAYAARVYGPDFTNTGSFTR